MPLGGLGRPGGLKINWYTFDRNVLGVSMCTIKENTETSVFISNEIGLELNDKKTKYMVMSQDQHAVKNHNIYIYIGNKSFERVENFKYLGTTLMNQNFIHEDIKCRVQSGNACCYSVQNLLSSSLLSKNIKVKIYRTLILPFVLYGCETWSPTVRK